MTPEEIITFVRANFQNLDRNQLKELRRELFKLLSEIDYLRSQLQGK